MNNNSIQFYNINVLRGLPNWDILKDTVVHEGNLVINAGGYAGCTLDNNYSPNALTAAQYRLLVISVAVDAAKVENYQNNIEAVIEGTYSSNSGELYDFYYSVNVSPMLGSVSGDVLTISRAIEMENMNLVKCTVYILNHTDVGVTVSMCSMLRSQDISSGQIGEAIGFTVTLTKVIDHPNGIELFYDGIEKSDKLFWIVDASDAFAGINVNNKFRINFERSDTVMTM